MVVGQGLTVGIRQSEAGLPVADFVDDFQDHDVESLLQGQIGSDVAVFGQGASPGGGGHDFAVEEDSGLVITTCQEVDLLGFGSAKVGDQVADGVVVRGLELHVKVENVSLGLDLLPLSLVARNNFSLADRGLETGFAAEDVEFDGLGTGLVGFQGDRSQHQPMMDIAVRIRLVRLRAQIEGTLADGEEQEEEKSCGCLHS